jgi:ectoine hydroxylase-related dioxygenase (phytanoyl-CoA dioxygenase family)
MEVSTEPNIPAELKAGDALLINGFIAHGRGFNRTQEPRCVIFCDFIPSFLIPDEAYLSLS